MWNEKCTMPFDSLEDHIEYVSACMDRAIDNVYQYYSFLDEVARAHVQVFEEHGNTALTCFVQGVVEVGMDMFFDWLRWQYGAEI